MRSGVIAQKVGMTRVFTETGEHIPVTVLKLGNCQVLGHRTTEKNGYVALQLGSGTRKTVYLPKAERAKAPDNALAERAVRQLERYLDDPQFHFTLPLAPVGTPFRRRVWEALERIPVGESRT